MGYNPNIKLFWYWYWFFSSHMIWTPILLSALLQNVIHWSALYPQVHIWNCSSVCVDGTADSEKNEGDCWLAKWRRRWNILPRLVSSLHLNHLNNKHCHRTLCIWAISNLFGMPIKWKWKLSNYWNVVLRMSVVLSLLTFSLTGGAISNMYSVMIARYKHFPEVKTKGMTAAPRLVLFTSEHVCIVSYWKMNLEIFLMEDMMNKWVLYSII